MDSILVVGVETVVGANLAACLADQCRVTGLTAGPDVSIGRCRIAVASPATANEAAGWIDECKAGRVVLCGPAAVSSWDPEAAAIDADAVAQADLWAEAARKQGGGFTFISSDAVFTGPWLFHDEDGAGQCGSPQAKIIRQAERQVLAAHPQALVVRTNAFGWSPFAENGWIEQRLDEIRTRRLADQDCIRHATPILATDLAGILQRAWSEGLCGVHHIAGAERVNPLKFVQRLAERFDLPWLSIQRGEVLQERVEGFGEGECGLQTKRLRKALCVAMPMLSESLDRLAEQDAGGFRARLCGQSPRREERAA